MIETAAGTILYSGSRHFVGDDPEAAAIWDLALFGVWYDAQLGVLRALDTIRRAGIDLAEFAETAGAQLGHVVSAVPDLVTELRRADYPAGPASLREHLPVIRRLVELRAGQPLGDGGLPAVAARVDALIAAGRGEQGLTATVD
jgi:hypothetical protein